MKNILLTTICLAFATFSFSQVISRDVVSSGGNYSTSAAFSFSSTIGEPMINTFTGTGFVFTQGFQQSFILNGCIDPLASNYDPTALSDDGSCCYTAGGCLDLSACNYDALVCFDNGSCIYNSATTDLVTQCEPYTWNGVTYTSGGVYTFVTTNAAGCDSTATLNLTINQSTTSSTTEVECATYTWNGTTYTTGGVYTFVTTNAANCDSTATLNLTINNATTSVSTIAECAAYTWNDSTYTTGGVYTFVTTNAAGCDSIATLNLMINESTTSSTTEVECATYTWNGVTYTSGGVYTFVTTNAAGCDSTATLNLTINNATTSTEITQTCFSYNWNGQTYDTTGVYTYSTTNSIGCDSTITLFLTINEPVVDLGADIFACVGDTVTISDVLLDASHIFSWTSFQGITSQGITANSLDITSSDYYYLMVTDTFGCIAYDTLEADFSDLSIAMAQTPSSCSNWADGSVSVSVSGGISPYTYQWNTGNSADQVGQLVMGTYWVTVTDSNSGCVLTDTILVQLNVAPSDSMHPEICYVSVDDGTGFNRVVLKSLDNPLTASYVILRQASANQYLPLDTIDASILEYLDTTSNPAVQAERYKVSAIDACGNGTDTSAYHKTVHLTMNTGASGEVNLIWNSYEGYQVTDYQIYRGTNATNMLVIGTTAGNNSSYTDLAPPAGALQYQIRAFAQNCASIPNAFTLPDILESNVIDHNNNTLTVSISSQNPTCPTCSDGYAVATATNGTNPYTYMWSNDVSGSFNFNIGVGTYTVFVSDSDGNVVTATVTLTAPVSGCTDSTATNYDPLANNDDGTCSYISTCTSPSPTGAYVSELIHDRVRINWDNMNDANCMVTQYRVKYRALGSSTWSQKNMANTGLCQFGLNTTSKIILGLMPSTTYEYYMKAWYCGGSTSDWSAIQNFTTADECENVINFAVSTPTTTKAEFTWDSTAAYSFARIKLRVDTTGSVWTSAGGFGVFYPALSKDKNGLIAGTSYRAQARTWCDPTGGAYRSEAWSPLVFWTQPTSVKLEGVSAINNLFIYPNPSRDVFNVSFISDTKQNLSVRILNIIGEELINENLEQFIGEYTKQINLSNNAKGIYFLEIETNNGIINKKLILQ